MPKKSDLHDCFVPYVIFERTDKFGNKWIFNSEELKNNYEANGGWRYFPLMIAN